MFRKEKRKWEKTERFDLYKFTLENEKIPFFDSRYEIVVDKITVILRDMEVKDRYYVDLFFYKGDITEEDFSTKKPVGSIRFRSPPPSIDARVRGDKDVLISFANYLLQFRGLPGVIRRTISRCLKIYKK